jgi:hypothetical protein
MHMTGIAATRSQNAVVLLPGCGGRQHAAWLQGCCLELALRYEHLLQLEREGCLRQGE